MLRVEIVLDPADGGPDRSIARLFISNDCTGTPEIGHYDAELRVPDGPTKRARVEDWPRRSRSHIDLVREALLRLA